MIFNYAISCSNIVPYQLTDGSYLDCTHIEYLLIHAYFVLVVHFCVLTMHILSDYMQLKTTLHGGESISLHTWFTSVIHTHHV